MFILNRSLPVALLAAFLAANAPGATDSGPLKIIQTTELRLGDPGNAEIPRRGEVRVAILVDETGRLVDWLLLGYPHRAMADAAISGLKEWRYEPATKHGQAVGQRTIVRIEFESGGRVISIRGGDAMDSLLGGRSGQSYVNRMAEQSELDHPLGVSEMSRPRFPAQLVGRGPEASSVLIDFYVDEAGRPRMPVVLSSENSLFAMAALDALDAWRFVPPTRKGQPVVVHVRQEFVFSNVGPDAS